jgi:hypothetical protein
MTLGLTGAALSVEKALIGLPVQCASSGIGRGVWV